MILLKLGLLCYSAKWCRLARSKRIKKLLMGSEAIIISVIHEKKQSRLENDSFVLSGFASEQMKHERWKWEETMKMTGNWRKSVDVIEHYVEVNYLI